MLHLCTKIRRENDLSAKKRSFFGEYIDQQVARMIMFNYNNFFNCVLVHRTQPLICIGYSMHYWVSCAINKGGFFEIAFVVVVDTHLPRFEALAYILPHFDKLTHVVIRASSAFIIQACAEVFYSVFVSVHLLKVC